MIGKKSPLKYYRKVTNTLRNQIELLEELHEIDQATAKIVEEIESIPLEIEKIENALEEEKAEVNEAQETLLSHEKEKREKDDELSVNTENMDRFQGRLKDIKTNAEYQASLKEIDQAKKQVGVLEEELLTLMESIEGETGNLTAAEAVFAEKKEKAEEEKNSLIARKEAKEKELKKIEAERKAKKSSISSDLTDIYEGLKKKMNGNILARANNGSCSGCFMQIPPQLINDAMKLEKLYQCPHCQRILIIH
jgi:hypothetical protein